MCSLLISVRSAAEALLAKTSGADFIDLKDPNHGALGALGLAETASVIAALNGESTTSATVGDLPMEPDVIEMEIASRLAFGIDYLKVGFFPASMQAYERCLAVIQHYSERGHKIIIVLFADYEYPQALMPALEKANIAGVMLDTASKNGKTLLDYVSLDQLNYFVNQMKPNGLLVGLAGSLQLTHVSQLKLLEPDYLGFRSGVCDAGQRMGSLNAARIRELSKLL